MYRLVYAHSVGEEQLFHLRLLLLPLLGHLRLAHVYLQILFAERFLHKCTSVLLLLGIGVIAEDCLVIEVRQLILVFPVIGDVKVVTQGRTADFFIFSLRILLIRLQIRLVGL